ncbi:hypothetical protein M409DRAFT_21179 [Zasmidium cellare ATCC 36951]|uniref:CSD domain-containing protein n=1 Tax=Zasmidium cellare ATCC 36951 TaxID=1080233 RepID=A0A6A6CRL7_ZASCE|nr:uncharacterized protein M409DRAFT_21179 [Zasmidium cellare ATCC 36951]KAF2168429.1 hypothetical protein M409DRAFT_21179 [Zasmidium cellare ATCC 36951]
MTHKGTIKSFDHSAKSGYIVSASRRCSLVFNVADIKGDKAWVEQGMTVFFDVVGFAAKNIRQDLISYALEDGPEPVAVGTEPHEVLAS